MAAFDSSPPPITPPTTKPPLQRGVTIQLDDGSTFDLGPVEASKLDIIRKHITAKGYDNIILLAKYPAQFIRKYLEFMDRIDAKQDLPNVQFAELFNLLLVAGYLGNMFSNDLNLEQMRISAVKNWSPGRPKFVGEITDIIDCRKRLFGLKTKRLPELFTTADELLTLSKNHLPQNLKSNILAASFVRLIYTSMFSWAIPTRPALDKLLKFIAKDQVLEIGGGRGLWTALLQASGIDVICTSLSASHNGYDGLKFSEDWTWTKVELLEAEAAISKYQNRSCLFVSWGAGTLSGLTRFKGNKLIVIGEGEDGCTDYITDGEDGFKLCAEISIPQWSGINDIIRLYRRQTKS